MALTAYSIERAGTTYHYSTARSQRDCFTTLHCGEIRPLHPTSIYGCRAISEPLCRHISLTASILSPPPPKARAGHLLGGCTGAVHHSYQTTRRLTQQASAPMVVPYALVPSFAPHQPLWDCCIKAHRCVAFGIRLRSHTEVCSLQASPSAPCASSFLQSLDNLACKIGSLLTFATVSLCRILIRGGRQCRRSVCRETYISGAFFLYIIGVRLTD